MIPPAAPTGFPSISITLSAVPLDILALLEIDLFDRESPITNPVENFPHNNSSLFFTRSILFHCDEYQMHLFCFEGVMFTVDVM